MHREKERPRASVGFAPGGKMFVITSCSELNEEPITVNGKMKHMLRLHVCSIPPSEEEAGVEIRLRST